MVLSSLSYVDWSLDRLLSFYHGGTGFVGVGALHYALYRREFCGAHCIDFYCGSFQGILQVLFDLPFVYRLCVRDLTAETV